MHRSRGEIELSHSPLSAGNAAKSALADCGCSHSQSTGVGMLG